MRESFRFAQWLRRLYRGICTAKLFRLCTCLRFFVGSRRGVLKALANPELKVLANSCTSQPIPIVASQVINTEWISAQKLGMHSLHLSQHVRKSRFASACWVSCPFLCYSIWKYRYLSSNSINYTSLLLPMNAPVNTLISMSGAMLPTGKCSTAQNWCGKPQDSGVWEMHAQCLSIALVV